MANENVELVRRAYRAYADGDMAAMLELVDPDLEWTYLDPNLAHPTPQVCHGRHELEGVLRGWADHGLRAELEEVAGSGELVLVGVRTPGVDAHYGRRGDDRAYSVVTVRQGRIVALRDCCDRQEALQLAGIVSSRVCCTPRPPGPCAAMQGGGAAAHGRGRPVAFAGLDPVAAPAGRLPRPVSPNRLGAVRRPSIAVVGDHPEATVRTLGCRRGSRHCSRQDPKGRAAFGWLPSSRAGLPLRLLEGSQQ